MEKKILICIAVLACMLVTAAYAQEEDTNVLDAAEADEPIVFSETAGEAADISSDNSGDSDSVGADPDEVPGITSDPLEQEDTLHVVETSEPEQLPEEEPEVYTVQDVTPEPTESPEPAPSPDPETMTIEEETLYTLGRIEGLLIFFAVVLLCFFAYKFFRIFF